MKNNNKQNNLKKRVSSGLSSIQKDFVNAINFEKLNDALSDPDFIKVLNKIKL